jgi:hypothetical protein
MDRKGHSIKERLASLSGIDHPPSRVQGRISSACCRWKQPQRRRDAMDQTVHIPEPIPMPQERVIRGAEAIAEHIFGDRASRRKVYYLAEKTRIPIFRLGSTLCLRPSAYERWVAGQEARAVPDIKRSF